MHVQLTKDVDAPAEIAWQILGPEFATIAEWADFVRASKPVSTAEVPASVTVAANAPVPGRETTTKATLREFITSYDEEGRTLTFDADGLPAIVTRGRNVQSVTATGPETSRVTFDIDFDFRGPFAILGPIMRKRMGESLGSVMDDLKAEAERRHHAVT